MSRNLGVLQNMLYQLKQDYGNELDIYRMTPGVTNLETGVKTTTQTKYHIDLGIVVPYKADTLGFYTDALLKAARQFSYGGYQDEDIKRVLLDGCDLPDDFDIVQSDVVLYRGVRYEIKVIERLEANAGYNLMIVALKGVQPNQIHEITVYQSLRIIQTHEVLLNE